MGDAFSEASDMESPVHVVYISTFYIEKTEVTYDAWDDVATWATNHGYSFGPMGQNYGNYPREDISWYNAAKWCNARSEKDGRVPAYYTDETQTTVYREGELNLRNSWVEWNTGYRLPTEAEWEKAARGGLSSKRFPWGNTISHDQANYFSDWVNGHPRYPYDLSVTYGSHPSFTRSSPAG